jgi:hypothetical protein
LPPPENSSLLALPPPENSSLLALPPPENSSLLALPPPATSVKECTSIVPIMQECGGSAAISEFEYFRSIY